MFFEIALEDVTAAGGPFAWLDRAYRQKDSDLWNIKPVQVDPLMKAFSGDPRFTAFLRKMNLPE